MCANNVLSDKTSSIKTDKKKRQNLFIQRAYLFMRVRKQ